MARNLPRFLLALVLLAAALVANPFVDVPSASAAVVWHDGDARSTRVINCVGVIQGTPWEENGLTTWVGFSTDPDAGKPEVGQVYYVHIVLGAPGNPCPGGQVAWPDLVLPPNTVPAVSQSAPIRCQYRGSAWSTNCAQLQQKAANRFWVANPVNAGTEYGWPLATGNVLELQIPVRSSAPLASATMSAVVTIADGSAGGRTLTPQVPVFVFSANNQPPGTAPSFTFPTPSTKTWSTDAAPGFAVESVAYLQPQGRAGNAFYDLSLSPSMSPVVFGQGPVAVGADPNGYELYSGWEGYSLQPSTTYYWRPRYQPSGGAQVVGATQSFTTPASTLRTIGTGTAGSCTAAAVQTALAGTATDIRFDCGPLPVAIALTSTLTIGRTLTIDGDGKVTLTAPPNARHLNVTNGTVVLRGLVFSGADHTQPCGAIRANATGGNFVNLTITSSRVSGNRTTGSGGGVCAQGSTNLAVTDSVIAANRAGDTAGGILSEHNLTIERSDISGNVAAQHGGGVVAMSAIVAESTFSGNVAGSPSSTAAQGGALVVSGYSAIRTSTFSGNTAGDAAAIAATGADFLEVNGVTIAANTARAAGGAAVRFASSSTADRIENTILDGNTPRNCPTAAGWQITSEGYNLASDATCPLGATGDRTDVSARLGALGPNGGPTRTHALLPGSPAIDRGNNVRCAARDQRGISVAGGIGTSRQIDGDGNGTAVCDIGAFEIRPDGVAPTVAGIERLDPSPTAAPTVRWRIRFSEPVIGVDAADLALTGEGVVGAAVSAVGAGAPAPTTDWTVTATTGTGAHGTLRLDVAAGASIRDATNVGIVAGATGPTYTIARGGPGGPGGPGAPVDGEGYAPLVPGRLADTRPGGSTIDGLVAGGGPVGAGQVLHVPVTGRGGVPADAAAVSLNVTIADPADAGYATVWPCDQPQPNASNLNYQGATIPNAVITKVAADGAVCIYTVAAAHVLVDVNGSFVADSDYTPLVPARVLDTRAGGSTIDGLAVGDGPIGAEVTYRFPVAGRGGVPAGAAAVSLNVTAVDPQAAGYATVWPCDEVRPNASNLNYGAGATIPNAVLTKLDGEGQICIAPSATTDVLVDVNGAFAGTDTFEALVPARLADTRPGGTTIDGQSAGEGVVAANGTLSVQVAGRGGLAADSGAASLNVTAVDPGEAGYLTVWPCDRPQPNASNLNYAQGQTIPNAVLSQVGADGRVCIFTSAPTHVLVDVTGGLR